MQPTKYQEWMIETGSRNDITSKYHLLAKVLPGRGKTTGLALHILQRLKLKERERPEDSLYRNDKFPQRPNYANRVTPRVRAVIICGTREAAYATSSVIREIGKYLAFRSEDVIGGGSMRINLSKAQEGLDIIVCSIGKLERMIQKEPNLLFHTEILCFDDTKILLQASDDQTRAQVRHIIKFCVSFLC